MINPFHLSFHELKPNFRSDNRAAVQSLLASYELFSGVKRWLHVTIFQSSDINDQFWQSRAEQIQLSPLMAQLPQVVTQYLYLKSFRTQLATLRLSHQLQVSFP